MTDTRYIEDLRRRYNAGAKLKFVNFWGHQPAKHGITASCFSQWYGAPFEIEGQRYPTAEHYMMAEKARLFGDEATRALVFKAPNPGAAKALGRQVMGFNDETWLANRYAIVVRANEAKFGQNPELREFLLQTGNRVLVEASPVDRIWGVGMAQDDEHIANPNLWRGLNLLGFALMQVRDTLRA
ncbi:NADAR family protein [Achromobacter animicus]|uniref:NADAR family protein n=1 Tax=Achromobacter animicus TaxID=1389935 RepID=UPI00244A1031|nr:NADAR family protein [Achromobacter animicus]MDH0682192.1 NADAR family protein [Achromobacter animicus]